MEAINTREVARRTGLTSRALRFYEARGLVRPARTWKGARLYGPTELERLARVVALKRAGLTLAQIARVLSGRAPDLAELIDAQLTVLSARRAELDAALAGLHAIRAALNRGEALGVADVCEIINQGGRIMTEQDWKTVIDRYYSPEDQARWAEKMALMPPGFQNADYGAKWTALGGRIAADLPMDPAGAKARAYVAEWNALLAPFMAVADTRMKGEATQFWENRGEWGTDMPQPFSEAVWAFMKQAMAERG